MDTTSARREIKTPGTFWEDHVNRSSDPHALRDAEIRWTKRDVYVSLTDEQLSELLCDAEFYADGGGGFVEGYRGIMSSARATAARIREANR